MSLAEQLLRMFQGWTSEPVSKSTLNLRSEDLLFSAKFKDANELACSINELSFQITNVDWSFSQSKKIAEQIVNQWDFLLEGLAIIESDIDSRVIQIRSASPVKTLGSYQYYEALIEPTGLISLKRFECASSEKTRVCTPMSFTKESLVRLCERTETLLLQEMPI